MSVKVAPIPPSQNRLEFGVTGLDAMLGGGVTEGSTTALIGPAGTGKTLLGLSFLATGLRRNEPGVYVGLREPPERAVQQGQDVGMFLADPLARGLLKILWFPAVEVSIDALAWSLMEHVEKHGVKRVFVDGVDGFHAMLVYPERLSRFCTAFITRLGRLGCTTITAEGIHNDGGDAAATSVADNVLSLSETLRAGRVRRFVTSQKRQGGRHELSPRRLRISDDGLFVDRRRWWPTREDKP